MSQFPPAARLGDPIAHSNANARLLAKVVGTAVVARLFTLTQPALMQLRWFAWTHAHWMQLKHAVLERARAS